MGLGSGQGRVQGQVRVGLGSGNGRVQVRSGSRVWVQGLVRGGSRSEVGPGSGQERVQGQVRVGPGSGSKVWSGEGPGSGQGGSGVWSEVGPGSDQEGSRSGGTQAVGDPLGQCQPFRSQE